jgi:hypothetical protein
MGSSAFCLQKKGEFVARSIAGETIIVPVRGRAFDLEAIYNLNEVGAFIWERIDGGTTAAQIAEAVSSEFEVMPGEAAMDIEEFIADLGKAGILEHTPQDG